MLSGTATAFIEAGMFFAVMQGVPFYAGTGCTNTDNIRRILSYQKNNLYIKDAKVGNNEISKWVLYRHVLF